MDEGSWYLRLAAGACQEYTSQASSLQLVRPFGDGLGPNASLVRTPDADSCQENDGLASASYWLQFVSVLIFFVFLVTHARHITCAGPRRAAPVIVWACGSSTPMADGCTLIAGWAPADGL